VLVAALLELKSRLMLSDGDEELLELEPEQAAEELLERTPPQAEDRVHRASTWPSSCSVTGLLM